MQAADSGRPAQDMLGHLPEVVTPTAEGSSVPEGDAASQSAYSSSVADGEFSW